MKTEGGGTAAFETRDFYLACFLRCTGYELLPLAFSSIIKDMKALLHNA
jgi:hypothetical protein